MAMNKRKTTTAIVAGVTAVALLLGGTFAWTSISQQARNEAIVDINPGGRLHDDFNGKNKDVYVENFGDDITGVPIFARIRLDQYFEVGQEAGKNKTTDMADRNVDALIGEDIDDVTTWETYIPGDGDLNNTAEVPANGNWSWALGNGEGNLPIYLPTFNMNKDSLAADINGTYEGTKEGDIVHYDDYKTYTDGQAVPGTEVYDWDSNTDEEEENDPGLTIPYSTTDPNAPIDDAHVYLKSTDDAGENLTHEAQSISTTATVITMQQWIDDYDSQPGNYWVYDTDGWAYWANPIQPGETTGLLLDSINMTKVPDDNYYYGINVVGQFATDSDWTMLYESTENGGGGSMTEEAKNLMGIITGTAAEDGGNGGEGEENPPAETPTYYTMDVAYPLESGTEVNLGVQNYNPVNADVLSYYIINKANNPNGGSADVLEAKDGLTIVPITYSDMGGTVTRTSYYYAELFTNSSNVTTTSNVEGVTFVAMDGDEVVAYTCTKVYNPAVHTYLGYGNHIYEVEGVQQNAGCLVFKSVANPDSYCTVGDANIGVDGDDVFRVTNGVTAAEEGADYAYVVTDITDTDCSCTANS